MKNYLLAAGALLAGLTSTAQAQTAAFVQWPLTANTSDNTTVRSASVTPVTPLLHKLVLSDGGTGGGSVPAYSTLGQAFGAVSDGSGFSTAASSPKGAYYEQFAITATAALRVDSLLFNVRAAQSANGKFVALYSLNGFATDSLNMAYGKGPVVTGSSSTNSTTGGTLPAASNATFGGATGTSAALNGAFIPQNNSSNPKDDFHFAFSSSANGLTLNAGQTLTVRLYFGLGSNTAGRYILLRNVTFKSRQAYTPMFLAARAAVSTNLGLYPNPAQGQLTVPHAAARAGAQVLVYSATGARVLTQPAQPGSLETSVSLDALTRGLYLVEYADGENRSTARLVKE